MPPARHLGLITLVVRDYDEAIAWYVACLGFVLVEDRSMGSKRWVVIAPSPAAQTRILLARAADEAQSARIGDQTGGRVSLFLHTDNFDRDHTAMSVAGVRFIEAPRREPYATVAVFEDLYGNRWDLLQPAP